MSAPDPELEKLHNERVRLARGLRYVRCRYHRQAALVEIKPNEAGYVGMGRYDGGPYDRSRFRIKPGAWDHEHCFVCSLRIQEGDWWWAALPPDDAGLCESCHAAYCDGAKENS